MSFKHENENEFGLVFLALGHFLKGLKGSISISIMFAGLLVSFQMISFLLRMKNDDLLWGICENCFQRENIIPFAVKNDHK